MGEQNIFKIMGTEYPSFNDIANGYGNPILIEDGFLETQLKK